MRAMAVGRKKKRGPGRPAHPIQRHELIAISRRAFASDGYAGTSLSQIAALAGIQKASLYYHFPAKEALYLAVIQEIVVDLRRLVADARLGEGDFVARVDRLGALVVEYLATHVDAGRLLVRDIVGNGPYMRGRGEREVAATLAIVTEFLKAGMDAGEFRRQDPKQLAFSIIGLHLFYFATSEVTSSFLGEDIFSEAMIHTRKDALLPQVRSLCVAG